MDADRIIEDYENVLSTFGRVVDFDISALDRLDVPVTSCSMIESSGGVDRFTAQANGYGGRPEIARLGGLGELAEGVLMGHAVPALLEGRDPGFPA